MKRLSVPTDIPRMTGIRRMAKVAIVVATATIWSTEIPAQTLLSGFVLVPPGKPRPVQGPTGCADPLCQKLKAQLLEGCSSGQGVPYADTVFLRRQISLDGSEDVRNAIAVATLAQDADFATETLTPYLSGGTAEIRYATALHIILAVFRQTGSLSNPATRSTLSVMRENADEISFPASDLYFFEAIAAIHSGEQARADRLLVRAIEVEMRFFNAHALRLRERLIFATRAVRQGPSQCRAAFTNLFEAVTEIMDLEPCPLQAAHLEIYLSRHLTAPENNLPLQALRVYLAVLSGRGGVANAALDAALAIKATCSADIEAKLLPLLELVEMP